jgi:hypothetical protein
MNGGGSLYQSAINPPQWLAAPQNNVASAIATFVPPLAARACEVLTFSAQLRSIGGSGAPLGFYMALAPLQPSLAVTGPPGPWILPTLDAWTDQTSHPIVDSYVVLRPDRPYWIPAGQQIVAAVNAISACEFVGGWFEYVQPLTQ